MDDNKTRSIEILWEGPYSFSEISTLRNEDTDYGVYQIYGKHVAYGDNALLYIGQASYQTFGSRIKQHSYWIEPSYSIYVGRLCNITPTTATEDLWATEINDAERFLIYVHKPAYNTMNKQSVDYSTLQQLHIINLGECKNLLPEISGLRWLIKNNNPDMIYNLNDMR